MERTTLEGQLSAVIDTRLALPLINEFVGLEEAFALRKWKYSELDGGRFAEVAARAIYTADSQNLALTKSVDDCLKYIENQQVGHHFPEPQAAIHLSKVIRAIYKMRSQRGAVHVSPTYTANEMDSRLIVDCTRWVFAEILRLFILADRELVAATVRELTRFPLPLIRLYGGQPLLQATTFTIEEEILAHLLHADAGLTLRELTTVIPKDRSGISRAAKKLASARVRQVVERSAALHITDLGITRIEERIAHENNAS